MFLLFLIMPAIHIVFCYRLEEQEKVTAAVEGDNKTLRALNVELQQHLLKRLNAKCSGEDIFHSSRPKNAILTKICICMT